MYNVTPADAKAVFELNKDKQNAFVQELMKNNQLVVEEGTNGEWRIAFTAPIDIKKVGNLKVDIYDAMVTMLLTRTVNLMQKNYGL